MIKRLIELGAAIDHHPLQRAVVKGNMELVACLRQHGSPMEFFLPDSTLGAHYVWSPLFDAIRGRHAPMIRCLLSLGAQTEVCSPTSGTPFHLAVFIDNADAMTLLADFGANLSCTHPATGRSPLADLLALNRHGATMDILESLLALRRAAELVMQTSLADMLSAATTVPRTVLDLLGSYVPLFVWDHD